MTTSEALPAPAAPFLLRTALMGNAAFLAMSGIVLAAMSALIGVDAPFIFALLGVGLVLYTVALFLATRQRPINTYVVWTAILMDDGWVIGSVALLVFAPNLFSPSGTWLVAIIVAIFAVAQFLGLRRGT